MPKRECGPPAETEAFFDAPTPKRTCAKGPPAPAAKQQHEAEPPHEKSHARAIETCMLDMLRTRHPKTC